MNDVFVEYLIFIFRLVYIQLEETWCGLRIVGFSLSQIVQCYSQVQSIFGDENLNWISSHLANSSFEFIVPFEMLPMWNTKIHLLHTLGSSHPFVCGKI